MLDTGRNSEYCRYAGVRCSPEHDNKLIGLPTEGPRDRQRWVRWGERCQDRVGEAEPGLIIEMDWACSLSRNWVGVIDINYLHSPSTAARGSITRYSPGVADKQMYYRCRDAESPDSAYSQYALWVARRRRGRYAVSNLEVRIANSTHGLANCLPRRLEPVKLFNMKRQLIAIIVMLVIGLQNSGVAFAGISPLMSPDCQTAVNSHSDASQDSCCPKGQRTMSCCLEACAGTVAGAVTTTPRALNWLGSTTLHAQFRTTHFSTRGDSPLIRPPIL